MNLDPEKVLHLSVWVAVYNTSRLVELPDFLGECVADLVGRFAICDEIDMLDLLLNDPPSHRVDIETEHIASQAIGFQQGSPPPHERIGYDSSLEGVGLVETVSERSLNKLSQQEASKEGPWATGKPLVDGDDRAVVLLDLLLSERQVGDEGNVKIVLD